MYNTRSRSPLAIQQTAEISRDDIELLVQHAMNQSPDVKSIRYTRSVRTHSVLLYAIGLFKSLSDWVIPLVLSAIYTYIYIQSDLQDKQNKQNQNQNQNQSSIQNSSTLYIVLDAISEYSILTAYSFLLFTGIYMMSFFILHIINDSCTLCDAEKHLYASQQLVLTEIRDILERAITSLVLKGRDVETIKRIPYSDLLRIGNANIAYLKGIRMGLHQVSSHLMRLQSDNNTMRIE